ncbi:hypothetical protein CC1G_14082 [Coprinopsis cinerea okayama7|uniref:Uncharacterized protein n=1 Tax=Coprinopsis cinerea (strain Okayama-7 / 130 / ATCC MYA-4618 / FGSC 9003) TaxID=240176 RepID=D6RLA0_COPC7|nr:hypothetical protein CC1G_14082 [Coprinopsis cinerea okayama7\|eukprot:XP_002911550.1 hypothetical protein CC1G_14082 [Coprinopsis cinerea okayama7\
MTRPSLSKLDEEQRERIPVRLVYGSADCGVTSIDATLFAESLQNWRKNDGKSFQLGIGSGKEHSPWDKQGEERTMVMGC